MESFRKDRIPVFHHSCLLSPGVKASPSFWNYCQEYTLDIQGAHENGFSFDLHINPFFYSLKKNKPYLYINNLCKAIWGGLWMGEACFKLWWSKLLLLVGGSRFLNGVPAFVLIISIINKDPRSNFI